MKTMGTVIQTSNYAGKALAGMLDFSEISIIVELGGGDGAITKHLLKNLIKMHVYMFLKSMKPFVLS